MAVNTSHYTTFSIHAHGSVVKQIDLDWMTRELDSFIKVFFRLLPPFWDNLKGTLSPLCISRRQFWRDCLKIISFFRKSRPRSRPTTAQCMLQEALPWYDIDKGYFIFVIRALRFCKQHSANLHWSNRSFHWITWQNSSCIENNNIYICIYNLNPILQPRCPREVEDRVSNHGNKEGKVGNRDGTIKCAGLRMCSRVAGVQ